MITQTGKYTKLT